MEMVSQNFRLARRLQRSNSLLLASELAAADSEFSGIGAYQRLSQSMRFTSTNVSDFGCGGFSHKPTNLRKREGNYNWTEKLGRLFSFKGIRGGAHDAASVVAAAAANKPPESVVDHELMSQVANKKKRSSWLPDPDRRWPVQGW